MNLTNTLHSSTAAQHRAGPATGPAPPAAASGADPAETGLSDAERRELEALRARDREVRAHEQAHKAAAGPYAQGAPTYTYRRGPDQRMYAVGGEVTVDTSEVKDDPAATLRKAEIIRRAALAPANPSAQDRAVAAEATRMANEARAELRQADASERAGEADGKLEATPGANCSCGGAHSAAAHDGITAYESAAGSLAVVGRPAGVVGQEVLEEA